VQGDAQACQFLLDRTRHVSSPVQMIKPDLASGSLVSRIVRRHASEGWSANQLGCSGNSCGKMRKNMALQPSTLLFRELALVAAQ
jgi:hypothetical protein